MNKINAIHANCSKIIVKKYLPLESPENNFMHKWNKIMHTLIFNFYSIATPRTKLLPLCFYIFFVKTELWIYSKF